MPSLSSCGIQKSIGTSNAAAWKQAVTGMFPKFLVSIALELANGSVLLAACCLSLFLLPAAVIIHVHNKAQIVVKESQVPKYPAACYQAAAGMLKVSLFAKVTLCSILSAAAASLLYSYSMVNLDTHVTCKPQRKGAKWQLRSSVPPSRNCSIFCGLEINIFLTDSITVATETDNRYNYNDKNKQQLHLVLPTDGAI